MAPVTSHDSIRARLYNALSKRITTWKRAESDGGSKPNNTGYLAAIAILSAIIIGYILYRAVRWYFARTGRAIRLPNHKRADKRRSLHQQDRQTMIADISVTDANANYHQFPSLGSAQSNDFSPSSAKQFLPLSASTTTSGTGPKTPKLEWRPPTLSSWSKITSTAATATTASPPTPSKLEAGAVDATGGVSYPTQAHADEGRPKEKKNLFGFVTGRGGRKPSDAYTVLASPPPGGDIQAQIDGNVNSPPPVDITIGRGHGGAVSPPLPALPPSTPGAPLRRKSTRKAPPAVEESEENKETPSRPASRATVATVKGSRWTNASIDLSQRRTSAVPSPRVSSLYRSRLSSHSYTPASPNLPHPPVPPMPSLPAFLLAQQQQASSLNRSSSVRTTTSTHKNTDSMNSNLHRAHDTAASSTLLHDSTVPPSVASSEEISFDASKGVDGQSLPRTMVVTATFTPSLSDELPLTIGETVAMLEEYIDGWCFVQRVRVHLKPGVNPPNPTSEMVDPADTITVPVEGEGNSGAVPRFCVSDWPLPQEIISQLQAQHIAELAAQSSSSTMDDVKQSVEVEKKSVEKVSTEPHSFLPSPMSLEATTPAFTPTPAPVYAPSKTTTTMVPLVKRQEQRKGPNDLEIATPSDVPDSKFSSWGSTLAPSSARNPMISRGFATMQANTNIHATSPPPPLSSSSASTPLLSSSTATSSTAVHSAPSGSSQTLQQPSDARSANTVTSSHPSSSSSSPTSRVASVTSQPAPIAPPVTPATTPIEREEEDDGIKRVSKPPLAPRLSRFPSTTSMHDEELGPEEEFDPRLLQHMKSYTEANNSSHGGMNMNVPRASDRTVTMPPLSRKLPPTTSDSKAPPLPEIPSSTTNGFQSQNTQGAYGARPAFGYPSNNGYSNGIPSAMSSAMDTGMGTSVGSKTPSTSHTHARSGSVTKRFTSFGSSSSGGPGSARDRSGSVGMGGVGGPRPAVPSSERKGASGPGVVSFKSLRTGSSTAGVGVVGR